MSLWLYLNSRVVVVYYKLMMGYGYNSGWSMMGGAGTFGLFTWLVVFIDLVLVGIWLWQQISKK